MPELPEVEVVRRGLDRWVTGRIIADAEVLHARAVRRHVGSLRDDLVGEQIRCVSRRGKYLWMPLSGSDAALVAHLGMSGQLLMQPGLTPDETHLRARFTFTDHGAELRFVDQRTFGGLMVAPLVADGAGGQLPGIISHIARDPLDPAFDERAFETRLHARDTEIKRALLDQSLVSGIGNIYADESLWRAGLHGRCRTGSLDGSRVQDLVTHVRAVMIEALAEGGTSFDSLYVNVNGESGYFDRSLDAYGQEGEPCSRCGTLIERERFMNRSSAFCPQCQAIS